jgi:hypothetical protein
MAAETRFVTDLAATGVASVPAGPGRVTDIAGGVVTTPGSIGNVVGAGPVDISGLLDGLSKEIAAGIGDVQSPYLYIQAAGSDGSDGSLPGAHLRWDLLRSLGEKHIPKGNLAAGPSARYPASYGFNKADDFVTVLRVQYVQTYPCTVNFSADRAVAMGETGPGRWWKFDAVVERVTPAQKREVVIRFNDIAQYDAIRATIDPGKSLVEFLARYTGIVEAEVTNQLCFALTLTSSMFRQGKEVGARVEAISVSEKLPGADLFISCRRRFALDGVVQSPRDFRMCAENVKYFRFDYALCTPVALRLETYEQFIAGSIANKDPWEVIGSEFALADQDVIAYDRLEDSRWRNVNRKWPRYLGAEPASGLFTTSVPNYQAKWDPTRPPTNESTDANGLRRGVLDYLTLSMNPANPTALASFPAEDPNDKGAFEISYLQMLKLVALDFPVARMLGLGCIDPGISQGSASQYVYVAVYRTTAALEKTDLPAIVLPATWMLSPGETAPFPAGLSVPASANGAFVTLTSSNPALVSVSPATVFIPAGKTTSTLPTLKGIGIGTATITASAPGYAPASTRLEVMRVPSIVLPANTTLQLGEGAPFPVTLSAPMPAPGGTAPGDIVPRTHLYMTLPTSTRDYRLPPAPVQKPPTFGVTFDNGTGSPISLTDIDGYTPFDESRMINLHLQPYDTVQPFGPFFVPPTEFCSSEVTKPVFYGCRYKLATEPGYRVPELSNDPEFRDPSGVPEVAPLLPQLSLTPNGPSPPIYAHEEKENGLHRYALYGVNWYSRPSPLSNPQDVNTLIPERHTLLPPANLAVQLIQPEDPLLLTTALEQKKLAALSGDSTLVRCTFNWNQNHYMAQKFSAANAYADKVRLYFRPEPPRAVQGEIKSVTSISNTLVEVRTRAYVLTSVSPPQTVTPSVVPGDEPRFAGSSFATNQVLYIVDSVAQSSVAGEGAVFRIRKQTQSTVSDLNNNNQHAALTQVTIPSAGDRFLVAENMNEPANWGANQPLAKEVKLVNFLEGVQLHTETVTYPDGSQAKFNIGGIQEKAGIVELLDIGGTGMPIPGSKTGIFEITFASYQLAAHPDADVEWYKGTVRVPRASGIDKKVLEVWKIDLSGSTLKLTAYDPTFDVDVTNNYAPWHGYVPIQTGPAVAVNFHPGYRVYLKAQAGTFDQTKLLPGPTQSTRETLLAARSRNTTLARNSNLTPPVIIQARKVNPPLQAPPEPAGPQYATRPNFYGKATWTMDLTLTANDPYALVFYRANEQAILDTLYKGKTVDTIVAALSALPAADAAFGPNRWTELVNVRNLDPDHGFQQFTPGGFRFPIPDNDAYAIPETIPVPGQSIPSGPVIKPFDGSHRPGDPSVLISVDGRQVNMLDVVKDAINSIFLPLTESPLVYQFIKTGTQTSSKRPVTRNRNGDLLPFTSAEFDPSPMAVKHVVAGSRRVRFTDYTLDGAAKNIYFYYAVEMSDQMKLSPRSPISGPIRLVNSYPAEAPVIRSVTSVIQDSVLQIPTGVKLLVNAYLAAEGITKFNLYRATDANDAAATRTMKLVRAYDALIGFETEIVDDFSDLAFLPFGDPLFYRVVALREITNERNATEFIPSQPSTLARASIIDVDNPVAPPLVFSSDPPTMSQPVQLANVILSWNKVTHNATYYLYKQDASGNWTKIHQEKTDADPVNIPLASTNLGTGVLLKQDAAGLPIYHRFKVEVENTSGMFSLNEDVLSVPATCKEAYAFFDAVVSYADAFQPASPLSDRLCDPGVTTFPGTMTFQDIIADLPTAHVFDHTEIVVADGLGHAARKIINAAGGGVSFSQGDGTGIVLDGSAPNITYTVRVKVFTDSCQDGLLFSYKLRFGPEITLLALTSVLSYTDSMTTTSPLEGSFVASTSHFPTTTMFTDITVLPPGHTFVAIDIELKDDQGGSFSKRINVPHGSVSFSHGEGGLALDASAPNRTYLVAARLFTDLSPDGVLFQYNISYS